MNQPLSTLFLSLALMVCVSAIPATLEAEPGETASLQQLLRCHDRAVGGETLRQASGVEYELEIEEPGFAVRGIYKAQRPDTMRIDIFAGEQRVFSEGLEDGEGWQLPGDSTERVPTTDDGTAALRHGLQQPGHLWTLADMPEHGHELELVDRKTLDGTDYSVFELTLSDGFQKWFWVNEDTCLIERSRSFRAFHPDIDPDRVWIETVHELFRTTEGVTRPHRSLNIDLASGEVIGTTRVVAVRLGHGRPSGQGE